jgi:DNA-binding NtrC family response regulator
MKETVVLELDRKMLIEMLKITEIEHNNLASFISEIITNYISGDFRDVQKPSINFIEFNSIFKNRQNFHEVIEQYEKDLIVQALEQTSGIKARAAKLLKMNRTTLVEKIKKLKLE